MIDNTGLLRDLITRDAIRICDSPIFSKTPKALPSNFDFGKVEGMLLGLAIGDALGATSEGKQPADRHLLYGEIRDYLPGRRSNNRPVGVATDDTQLSFFTLEQLIDDNGLNPDNLIQRFSSNRITGIGGTVKKSIQNYKDRHIPWYEAGQDSRGNGALMRIAPIVLPYLCSPHPSLYADAALDTMLTHNNFANTASCVAFIKMLWDLLAMTSAPEPNWWFDTFRSTAKELEGNTQYNPRNPQYSDYEGPLWKFTHDRCREALGSGFSTSQACYRWGSGADLFETVPSVLYILATHAHNAEEAIIRAVNDTVDNDTVAAIVGAAVGALHGLGGIPERWLRSLEGKIREGGTGQVFRLIFHAKQIFWLSHGKKTPRAKH